MTRIALTHKHQTRANDCWYACIQMLRTYANDGTKTKPVGQGVTSHRNQGPFSLIWGNPLGSDDPHYQNILTSNGLIDVSTRVGTGSRQAIQDGVTNFGPLIFGGDFGKVLRLRGTNKWLLRGMGHYIVVTGTDADANVVHINDPWHTRHGDMVWNAFYAEVWKGDGRTIIANG